jgi:hypothetical protein
MVDLAAYTLGDISKASSRLRSFYLFAECESAEIRVLRNISYQEASECQIIHLQGVLDFHLFYWLVIWRFRKINVVYDLADQPGSWVSRLGYAFAIFLSNTLTVNTQERLIYWKKLFYFKRIVVIPDIADKNKNIPSLLPRIQGDPSINFFWIGHHENICSIQEFFPFLDIIKSRLLICTNIDQADNSAFKPFPIDLLQWQQDITFSSQRMNSFMLLSHDHDKNSAMKSNNKMVLAIHSGFIPIISRTPEYESLAKELNLEFLLFDDFSEVLSIAKEALSKDWDTILKIAQSHLDHKYSTKAVFSIFMDCCISAECSIDAK